MARSYDHFLPAGATRDYYPTFTRRCSRRCDYCEPRKLWNRSRERVAVATMIEVEVASVEVEGEVDDWCCCCCAGRCD